MADEIDLTQIGQPAVKRAHVWERPPPGAGPARNPTCRACGARRSVVGDDSACPGKHSIAVAETIQDYDPFADRSAVNAEAERRAANAKIKDDRRKARNRHQ